MTSSPELTPAEKEQRFVEMFGVSEADLVAQGIDVRQYIRDNVAGWMDREYDAPLRKLAAGESVLPYKALAPYITKGVTLYSRSWDGEVTVDRTALRLLDNDGTVLAEATPAQVRVRRVPIWLGIGVRLIMGPGDAWRVQPRGYPNQNLRKAWQANRVFRAALAEAGAHMG